MKKRVALALVFVNLSVITFQVYEYDKRNAQINGPTKKCHVRRVPEKTLHVLALLGGWPGALLAQQTLKHKTIEQPFQRIFWLTVLGNILLVLLVLLLYLQASHRS